MDFTEKELKAFEKLMDPARVDKYSDEKPGGIGLLVEENAERIPGRIAVCYEDKKITYADLNRGCNRIANHFLDIGAKRGQVCALFLENNDDYLLALGGLSKIGVVTSLLNTSLRRKSLVHAIGISRADYVLVHVGLLGAITDAIEELNLPRERIWVWGKDDSKSLIDNDFEEALLHVAADNPSPQRRTLMGDVVTYLFTSGTTGMPKAVKIRARNHPQSGELVYNVATGCTSDDTIYSSLPLNHAWGLIAFAGALCLGSSFALRKKFSARQFWDDIRKYKATVAVYIGEIPRFLCKQAPGPDDSNNPLEKFIGLGLKAEIWADFKKRFDIDEIIEVYGASEARGSLINLTGKVGMIGRILDQSTAAIAKYDLDADEFLRDDDGFMIRGAAPGDRGIYVINVAGKAVTMNEYTDIKETGKKILHDVFSQGDAWFNSGDLFELHEDGWLSFMDRLGDTFRWKSENVSTQEVESILMDFEAVELATVYGVHIENMTGQAGMASVVKMPETKWDWGEFVDFAQKNLPSYAIPRFIRFREKLEMTSTLKVKKVNLRNEGFDPSLVREPLYFWDEDRGTYLELDRVNYGRIISGEVRM